jgi:hypothetical protein
MFQMSILLQNYPKGLKAKDNAIIFAKKRLKRTIIVLNGFRAFTRLERVIKTCYVPKNYGPNVMRLQYKVISKWG